MYTHDAYSQFDEKTLEEPLCSWDSGKRKFFCDYAPHQILYRLCPALSPLPLSGDSCLLLLEPYLVSVPNSPTEQGSVTWLPRKEFKKFMDSCKCETPFGLRADILRHLGSDRWHEHHQLHRSENTAACWLSFGEPGLSPWVCLYAYSSVSFLHVCTQLRFPTATFCFLCHLLALGSWYSQADCSTHRPTVSSHLETPKDTSQKTNKTKVVVPQWLRRLHGILGSHTPSKWRKGLI